MIDAYITELDQALRGPRAAKADLLAEARDGLVDAVEAYQERGLTLREAEQRAVEEFGPVRTVAADYQGELGLAQGRRTAVLICTVMLAQPVMWWLLQAVAGADGREGAHGYEVAEVAVRWSGGLAIAAGIGVLFAAGTGVRYVRARHLVARATAFFAFTVCAVFAVLGVLMTVAHPATSSLMSLTGLPVTLLVLGVPLIGIAISGRRCLSAA